MKSSDLWPKRVSLKVGGLDLSLSLTFNDLDIIEDLFGDFGAAVELLTGETRKLGAIRKWLYCLSIANSHYDLEEIGANMRVEELKGYVDAISDTIREFTTPSQGVQSGNVQALGRVVTA